MYFSDEIILIDTDASGTDAIGLQAETETGRATVYGDIKSVSREESFTAGSRGYSEVEKIVLRPWDYSGQKYALLHGVKNRCTAPINPARTHWSCTPPPERALCEQFY